MDHAVIALAILAGTLVLYALPFIPISVTTVLAMLAMAASGIIPIEAALSGFSSNAVFLVAGMMIIGRAAENAGIVAWIGRTLYRFSGSDENRFMLIVFALSAAASVLLNPAVIVALFIPIIDRVSDRSEGRISRKQVYFPLGVATALGSNLTTFSATSMVFAMELMRASGVGGMEPFAPMLINLPSLVVVFAFYAFCGRRLQELCFDFQEQPSVSSNLECHENFDANTFKVTVTVLTVVGVVAGMIAQINSAMLALVASVVLILTGCVGEREALGSISWHTIVIVGAAVGLAEGVNSSGAGLMIADALVGTLGFLGSSPVSVCIILFLACSVLSNFLTDTGTLAIMLPIAFSLGTTLEIPVVPLALACTSGAKVAVATPICVTHMTMIQVVGYRFRDYLCIGGLVNVICMIVTCITIALLYF